MSQISESSELFVNCDEEVTAMCKRLQLIITSMDQQDDKSSAFKEAQNCIESATRNLTQMEIEIQGFANQMKENLKQQFQLQKHKLEDMKLILRQIQAKHSIEIDKESLFGKDKQRQQLLRNEERQYEQTQKLQEAVMIGYGIVKDADNVQLGLKRNEEKILRNIDKQQGIRSDLSDSMSLIRIMRNRIRDNKLVLYAVGGIVLLALLITIYMNI